jgi:nucleotide-binding universal stress UspA family protein
MKRFKNILVVTQNLTGDRHALRKAAELSQRNKARLSLIEVIETPESEIEKLNARLKVKDVGQLLIEDRKASLEKLLKNAEIQLSRLDIVFGEPFIKIIKHVQQRSFDLVVMAAEGKGGIKEKLFGTTSLHLMRKCPCPVWIHKPTRAKQYRKILAAVNPRDPDPIKEGLNRKIMELATSMAKIENGELYIIHVWDFMGESLLVRRGGLTRDEVKELVEETRAKHQAALEQLVNQHPTPRVPTFTHFVRGNPGEIMQEFAAKKHIDLIVMGTVGREGIAGLLIGNTAEQVIQSVNASVLTVKPKGFISPVQ